MRLRSLFRRSGGHIPSYRRGPDDAEIVEFPTQERRYEAAIDELFAAAGTTRFDEKMDKAIAALPEDEQTLVRDALEDLKRRQQRVRGS